jgi:hypothetical protein
MKQITKKIVNKILSKIYIFYLRNIRKFIVLTSFPFVSGDTFKINSDHILDDRNKINYRNIKSGDIIFVKPEYLDEFMRGFNNVNETVSIITHNSDFEVNYKIYEKYTNKKITWFAQNISIDIKSNSNIFPIPIGLENKNYFKNGIISNFTDLNLDTIEKQNKVLCSFNLSTNPSRVDVIENIRQNDAIDYQRFSNHKKYIQQVAKYKFNICPFGNGLDTHRIWESLMVGSIPVVLDHVFYDNFIEYGIPLLKLNSWDDLKTLNSTKIDKLYKDFNISQKDKIYLNFDFWFNKIKDISKLEH